VSVKIFCWKDDRDRWKISSSCYDRNEDKVAAFPVEMVSIMLLLL
jgi:hypothetical protein